jgi:hypothetical protein
MADTWLTYDLIGKGTHSSPAPDPVVRRLLRERGTAALRSRATLNGLGT